MSTHISNKGAIDRLVFGFFILFFGAVWLLHQAGIVQETAWIWPFAFMYFGIIVVIGAIYRLTHQAH